MNDHNQQLLSYLVCLCKSFLKVLKKTIFSTKGLYTMTFAGNSVIQIYVQLYRLKYS